MMWAEPGLQAGRQGKTGQSYGKELPYRQAEAKVQMTGCFLFFAYDPYLDYFGPGLSLLISGLSRPYCLYLPVAKFC